MTEYTITTDSDSMTIDASSADEAVAIYTGCKGKGGPATLDALISRIEEMGGELTVAEDGVIIARVR